MLYGKPIYITENGLSCHDTISLDGKVHDPNRINFLTRYLTELKKAAGEIELRGYFQWSLMDNFEWADPVGSIENLDDFFLFRDKRMNEIFEE